MNKTLKQKKNHTKKRKQKKITRKRSTQKKLAGIVYFQLPSDLKSRCRNHNFKNGKIGQSEWSSLTNWVASQVIGNETEKFDMDALYERLSHKDIRVRSAAGTEWCSRIGRAVIHGDGDRQFMNGERSTNFPRIKANNYKEITIEDLTWILMDHREKIKRWVIAKNKPKVIPKIESVPEPKPESELVIENPNVPDNWDASDDE